MFDHFRSFRIRIFIRYFRLSLFSSVAIFCFLYLRQSRFSAFSIFGFLYFRQSLFSAFSIFVSRYFRLSLFSAFAIFGFRYFGSESIVFNDSQNVPMIWNSSCQWHCRLKLDMAVLLNIHVKYRQLVNFISDFSGVKYVAIDL